VRAAYPGVVLDLSSESCSSWSWAGWYVPW